MFPPDCVRTVAIYHVGTTAGQLQTYTLGATVTAAMLPMDRKEHAMEGGDLVDPWELYLDNSVDIRVGDKLVIDSQDYFVRKTFVANFGGLRHIRASISRPSHA